MFQPRAGILIYIELDIELPRSVPAKSLHGSLIYSTRLAMMVGKSAYYTTYVHAEEKSNNLYDTTLQILSINCTQSDLVDSKFDITIVFTLTQRSLRFLIEACALHLESQITKHLAI